MAKNYNGRPSKNFSNGSGAHGMNSYRNNKRGSNSGIVDIAGKMLSDAFSSKPQKQSNYGQGKHSKGGKPKQRHW